MDTIGLVDGGEYGHASRHLSYPPILHACLTAGIKISAYGFALSEEPFDPDLDSQNTGGLSQNTGGLSQNALVRPLIF